MEEKNYLDMLKKPKKHHTNDTKPQQTKPSKQQNNHKEHRTKTLASNNVFPVTFSRILISYTMPLFM